MRLIKIFSTLIIFVFPLTIISGQNSVIKKVMTKMVVRQVHNGISGMMKADLFYDNVSSRMITHFNYPIEYIVVTNNKGELNIYNPLQNTIIQKQNFAYSVESSQLFFFLSHQTTDLGLKKMNYSILKTSFEKDLVITEWKTNTPAKKGDIEKVKLVHRNQNPIYMSYIDTKGKIKRKVFYSGYQNMGNINFPTSTTEIVFNTDKDSTINKTIYTEMKWDESAVSPYFTYQIPSNAKLEK
jgi:hypothetical protein